jgi:hypothetical protein
MGVQERDKNNQDLDAMIHLSFLTRCMAMRRYKSPRIT